jgi:hypothetical protein
MILEALQDHWHAFGDLTGFELGILQVISMLVCQSSAGGRTLRYLTALTNRYGRCNILMIRSHQSSLSFLLGTLNLTVFAAKFLAYLTVTSRAWPSL